MAGPDSRKLTPRTWLMTALEDAERLGDPRYGVVGALSYRRPQRQFRERVLCQMPTACHSRSFGQQDKWFLSPAWVANRLS